MVFSSSFGRFFCAGAVTATGLAIRKAATQVATRCDDHNTRVDTQLYDTRSLELAPDDNDTSSAAAIAAQNASALHHSANANKVSYPWQGQQQAGITTKFQPFKLLDVVEIGPGTNLFRFEMHKLTDIFHLAPCSSLQARYGVSNSPTDQIERFYTPCTPNGAAGHFDLIIKYQPNGRMTNAFWNLKPGDTVDFRVVQFKIKYKPNRWEEIGMIAGGSGITPMLQVIRQALPLGDKDPYYKCVPDLKGVKQHVTDLIDPSKSTDKTKLSLLFCNRSEKHILLKSYFDELQEMFKERFKVAYCVDRAIEPSKWKGYTGYVTKQMIGETMPKPNPKKNIVLLCGPDQLIHHVTGSPPHSLNAMHKGLAKQPLGADFANLTKIAGIMGELGYGQDDVYKF